MKLHIFPLAAAALMLTAASCSDHFTEVVPEIIPEQQDPNDDPTPGPAGGAYTELYRPQVHYTPAKNWVNDPNGLVYLDGTYHFFYQYNPMGPDWGNLSWGHATSTDLIHWQEQPVALSPDDLGLIFSGCCVIDRNNTAGFGPNAMVAFYTSADRWQQQSMAYSTDGGKSFTKYDGNPVVANSSMPDFRDPKVFWHEESKQWIMCLAKGWVYEMDLWASPNLKDWKYLSTFSTPEYPRCNKGQWECPDLMRMSIDGQDKWVLIISVNPGGPAGGSGSFYFPGSFDGKNFTADSRDDYPLWIDYGADNYAGVTWSNLGDRHVSISWMNNWNYCGNSPVSPWRSAFTLPRELTLTRHNGKLYLSAKVVRELEDMAGPWRDAASDLGNSGAAHLQVTVDLSKNTTLNLSNHFGETLEIEVQGPARQLIVKRNAKTGDVSWHPIFSLPGILSPVFADGDTETLDIYIDASSVEIIGSDGTYAQTNTVYPREPYCRLDASQPVQAKVRDLPSIWR